jgi:hypothetical protein
LDNKKELYRFPSCPLENLQATEKVPKPGSSGLGSLKAILALDALYGVSDVVLTAHADKVRMAIFFELNDGVPKPHRRECKASNKGQCDKLHDCRQINIVGYSRAARRFPVNAAAADSSRASLMYPHCDGAGSERL